MFTRHPGTNPAVFQTALLGKSSRVFDILSSLDKELRQAFPNLSWLKLA
jgi:hypothetical protein